MTPPEGLPRHAVVVLLDSLNRHLLGAWGGREFDTPNLDRLAARSLRFTRHYSGSLPCMPARHDILCGALDFLWRPWGSIEVWEEPLTVGLREAGVVTKLVTDHPHLFETGGENYHCDFGAWDYQRGHETDPWRTHADPSFAGTHEFNPGQGMPYERSRGWFRGEEDFPGPRTMAAAARWLREEAPHHERFLLFVDEFDPHEPFDTPEPWASRYDPDWEGARLIWPPYTRAGLRDGVLDERRARHIRANYGAKLSMIDHWLGLVLDALEESPFRDQTALLLCTDHGHYLGEHDAWGKPPVPLYEALAHTPLLVSWPGRAPGEVDALSTNVDLHATLLDLFGARARHRTHGRSLLPVLRGEARSVREHLLAGYWAREVHWIDGDAKYARAPAGDNLPLSMWSNRWSTMPVPRFPQLRLMPPDERARLDRMPGSKVPVLRQPFAKGDPMPYWAYAPFEGTMLFDLREDPEERRNLVGTPAERRARDGLRAALEEVEAPGDQLERLGLA